jgi:hypothetical protein
MSVSEYESNDNKNRYINTTFTLNEIETPIEDIMNCFELPYVGTIYSCQGGDIRQPFIIAGCFSGVCDREDMHTAVTRCIDMSHVYWLDVPLKWESIRDECKTMQHDTNRKTKKLVEK